MIEKATVVQLFENDEDKCLVEVSRSTACENCASKCMIATDTLNIKAEVEGARGVHIGEEVTVALEFTRVLSASFIMYFVPLVLFMLGLYLGNNVLSAFIPLSADLLAFFTGVILLAGAYIVINYIDQKGLFKKRYIIRLVK